MPLRPFMPIKVDPVAPASLTFNDTEAVALNTGLLNFTALTVGRSRA